MFKGILPPRRVPSSEFIIVTPLAENGKENLPSSPARPEAASPNGKAAAPTKSGKAVTQDKSKRKKGDIPHTAPAMNSTDREFDRLLVGARHRSLPAKPPLCSLSCRMISRSRPRSVRSSLAWILQSRQPCSSHLKYSRQPPLALHRCLHVAYAVCKVAAPSTLTRLIRAPPPSLITSSSATPLKLPLPHREQPGGLMSGRAPPRPRPANTLVACRSMSCRLGAQSRAPALRRLLQPLAI